MLPLSWCDLSIFRQISTDGGLFSKNKSKTRTHTNKNNNNNKKTNSFAQFNNLKQYSLTVTLGGRGLKADPQSENPLRSSSPRCHSLVADYHSADAQQQAFVQVLKVKLSTIGNSWIHPGSFGFYFHSLVCQQVWSVIGKLGTILSIKEGGNVGGECVPHLHITKVTSKLALA